MRDPVVMCDQCIELDKKIAHYQKLAERIWDPPTLRGLYELIEERKAQKTALHPEKQK
jgi:hypothetical protein